MSSVAYQDRLTLLLSKLNNLQMHLSDQWTCRIKDFQVSVFCIAFNFFGYTVRTENYDGTFRHLLCFINEYRPFTTQVFYNGLVVDNLVSDINRRTEFF